MAVQLKLADAFVDVSVNRTLFNIGLARVIADLGRLQSLGTIALRMDRSAATASLGLLRQQLDALKASATINVKVNRSGGFGSGGGGGGGGGFGMGLLQGLGVGGFAMNPAMMAGQMIGGGLKDAVSNAMDLEQTFVGLQRVSGESAANVEKFKRSIFDIGKTQAGVSIKDLTDISMAGAKAGITDKEGLAGLETFTRGMAKVRNSIQGMGTEQLANDMTRMLNLFHKGTDYVESFGSVLARMDNVSTSSASDILDMSKSLSGTFASLGMGIPQVMAFSSVLADVGLTNQQGASSFSQILRMLASQSEKLADIIGVPVDVFQEKVRTDAMGALGMLIARFRELNDVDPIKAQEFLVSLGFRGVKTAGALQQLSSMFEQVKERTNMAIEEEGTLGSLISANALSSTTATANIQKLKNAFEELSDAVGSKLVPHLTEAAKVGMVLVNKWGGGKPGGPEGLTSAEAVELAMTSAEDTMMSPAAVARREELKRKAVARAAFDSGLPLEAEAPTAEEQKVSMEKARADMARAGGNPSVGPLMEAGARAVDDAIAMKQAWADAAKDVASPVGGGDLSGGMTFAREQDRKQAAMFAEERERPRLGGRGGTAFAIADTEKELKLQLEIERSVRATANARGQDDAGKKATKAALDEVIRDRVTLERSLAEMRGARSGREGDGLDRKTPEELGRQFARPGAIPEVSEMRKKFMDPAELAEIERRKALEFIARPKEEEHRPSQMFTDPADYATHAIQAALTAKDDSPKQTAEATKRGAVLLQALVDAIVPVTKITPGKPNAGMFIFQHEGT